MRYLLILLLCLANGAAADGLQRLDTGYKGNAWRAVGRLDVAQKGFCTGTLIDYRVVLTAAHCVLENGQLIDPARMQFFAGLRGTTFLAERAVRRVTVHPLAVEGDDRDSLKHDIAILELQRPIRLPQVAPFEVAEAPRMGQDVAVVSYASGRSEAPSLEQLCRSLGSEDGVLVLSCEVEFGASGSPVFRDGHIVGMIAAMADLRGARVALALDLPDLLEQLRSSDHMREDSLRKVVRPRGG